MKFYPLKNWRKGQPTVLIDGDTYYTLEAATEWEINKTEEDLVTIAAHKGEEWLKEREKQGKKPTLRKGTERTRNDKAWISQMLGKGSTKVVASQNEGVVLLAPTPSGHQDAGTIKVNPEARKQSEKRREKKIFRTSPPATRSRKRARQATMTESRTASQDSCTPRNPQVNTKNREDGTSDPTPTPPMNPNPPFRHSEGYTPPPPRPQAFPAEGEQEMHFIRQALKLANDPTHEKAARKLIWGFMELLDAGVISTQSTKDLETIDREAIQKALLVTLVDDLDDQRRDANATKGDLQKMRNEITIQHQTVAKYLNKIQQAMEILTTENVNNNRALNSLVTRVSGAEAKFDAHWNELQRRLQEEVESTCSSTGLNSGKEGNPTTRPAGETSPEDAKPNTPRAHIQETGKVTSLAPKDRKESRVL